VGLKNSDMATKIEIKAGGKYLMANRQELIQKFVTANKLAPFIQPKFDPILQHHWPVWFKWGVIGPHLHLNDKVYMLDDANWNKFTKTLFDDFKVKLDKAKSVSFNDALNLSNSIDALGL
jgi:hypothetical protein